MSKRCTFTAEFKAKVVLTILSGESTAAQICRELRIKEILVGRWKKEFLERAVTVFGQDIEKSQDKERTAELECMVGRLTMDVDILKKKLRTCWAQANRETHDGQKAP